MKHSSDTDFETVNEWKKTQPQLQDNHQYLF